MPYQISREKVETHSSLLDKLAIRCIKQRKECKLTLPGDTDKAQFCWKLRELLASAEEYPRNQYDKALRSSVIVKQLTGEPDTVLIKPAAGVMLDETEEQVEAPTWEKVVEEYLLRKSEATVTWQVAKDAETEHNQFREALKANYETIQLIEEEEIGDTVLRTYRLFPRPKQRLTKEEYYKTKTKDPADMTPEERHEWAKEQARKSAKRLEEEGF